jgi:hypothetical protein
MTKVERCLGQKESPSIQYREVTDVKIESKSLWSILHVRHSAPKTLLLGAVNAQNKWSSGNLPEDHSK